MRTPIPTPLAPGARSADILVTHTHIRRVAGVLVAEVIDSWRVSSLDTGLRPVPRELGTVGGDATRLSDHAPGERPGQPFTDRWER